MLVNDLSLMSGDTTFSFIHDDCDDISGSDACNDTLGYELDYWYTYINTMVNKIFEQCVHSCYR